MDELIAAMHVVERLHNAEAAHEKAFLTLRALKEGKITLENLEANLNGWSVQPIAKKEEAAPCPPT